MCLALRLLSQQPAKDTTAYAKLLCGPKALGWGEPTANGTEQEGRELSLVYMITGRMCKGQKKRNLSMKHVIMILLGHMSNK